MLCSHLVSLPTNSRLWVLRLELWGRDTNATWISNLLDLVGRTPHYAEGDEADEFESGIICEWIEMHQEQWSQIVASAAEVEISTLVERQVAAAGLTVGSIVQILRLGRITRVHINRHDGYIIIVDYPDGERADDENLGTVSEVVGMMVAAEEYLADVQASREVEDRADAVKRAVQQAVALFTVASCLVVGCLCCRFRRKTKKQLRREFQQSESRLQEALLDQKLKLEAAMRDMEYPKPWSMMAEDTSHDKDEGVRLPCSGKFEIGPGSDEYWDVLAQLRRKPDPKIQIQKNELSRHGMKDAWISKLERIQNPHLYTYFEIQNQRLAFARSKKKSEWVWHGTGSFEASNIYNDTQDGFMCVSRSTHLSSACAIAPRWFELRLAACAGCNLRPGASGGAAYTLRRNPATATYTPLTREPNQPTPRSAMMSGNSSMWSCCLARLSRSIG